MAQTSLPRHLELWAAVAVTAAVTVFVASAPSTTGLSVLLVVSLALGALFWRIHDLQREARALREELLHKEEQYHEFTDHVAEVFWLQDADRPSYVSPQFERIWGISAERLLADPRLFIESIHPEDRDRVHQVLQMQRTSAQPVSLHYRIVRPDGAVRWIYGREVAVKFHPDGRVERAGIAMDVTESKEAEAALLRKEARFRTLFQYAPIAIWEQDMTELAAWMAVRRSEGYTNLWQYFAEVPGALDDLRSIVCVNEMNEATFKMFGAGSWQELVEAVTFVFTRQTLQATEAAILNLQQGETFVEFRTPARHLDGRRLQLWVRMYAPEREGAPDLSRVIIAILDITDQVTAERQLRDSEQRYRLLAENCTDVISRHCADTAVLYISPSCRELTGYAPDEIQQVDPIVLIHPDDVPTILAQQQNLMTKDAPLTLTLRLRHKAGHFIWIESAAKPIFDEETGEMREVVCITRDVTQRQVQEEALRHELTVSSAHGHLAAALILSMPADRISRLVIEYATQLTESSEGFAGFADPIGGRFRARTLGTHQWATAQDDSSLLELTALDDLPGWVRMHRQSLITNEAMEEAMRLGLQTPSGIHRLLSVPASVKGRLTGQITVANSKRDYTRRDLDVLQGLAWLYAAAIERQWTEEERLRLTTAIDQAAEMVVITDAEAHIQYVNPAFETCTGYRLEDLRGQHVEILRGETPAPVYEDLWTHLANAEVWRGRLRSRKKDGSQFDEEVTISPVRNTSGQVINFVALKRDVTGELLLERQLRQAQKMEAIGTLAGGIAHDFNNILAAILGFTEMANSRLEPAHQAREDLAQVLSAAGRARDLVLQILTFSRHTEQHRDYLDLRELLAETVRLLRATLPSTIVLECQIVTDNATVFADPAKLHQVIMNLSTNAFQAMRRQPHGRISLRLEEQIIEHAAMARPVPLAEGHYLVLSITDTGPGMDAETRDRIFEPFFTTKEPGEGTGLGLATVHGIVAELKGTVLVESEPGQGSTFRVYLPAASPVAVAGPLHEERIPLGTGQRILVVDDEPALVALCGKLLKTLGYEAETYQNSTEAWAAFAAAPDKFDMVLSDFTMPEMDGYSLAQRVAGIRAGVPFILMTGYSEKLSTAEIEALGIRHLLLKPFGRKELGLCVGRALAAPPSDVPGVVAT